MTPPKLARALVLRLKPSGVILEPAAGTGNFVRPLRRHGLVHWCEISRGRDFLDWTERVDWIVTNPPWSRFREFLAHALTVADRVAMLATLHHWFTRRRRELVRRAGFGVERIIECPTPREWGAAPGFQVGMVLLTRGYNGPCTMESLA